MRPRLRLPFRSCAEILLRLLSFAEAAISLATEHGFPIWLGQGQMWRGRALCSMGNTRLGIDQLEARHHHLLWNWRKTGNYLLGKPARGDSSDGG